MKLHERYTNELYDFLKLETEELNEFKTLMDVFTESLIKSIHETFIDIPKEIMKTTSEDQIARTALNEFKTKKRYKNYEPIIKFLAEKLVFQDKVQKALSYIAKIEDILIELSLKAQTKCMIDNQVGKKWT